MFENIDNNESHKNKYLGNVKVEGLQTTGKLIIYWYIYIYIMYLFIIDILNTNSYTINLIDILY